MVIRRSFTIISVSQDVKNTFKELSKYIDIQILDNKINLKEPFLQFNYPVLSNILKNVTSRSAQGKSYRTRLNAWKPGGYPGGFVQLGFTVNVPPASGTCDIHPLDGFAIVTNFSMKCSGWQDEDQPLRYLIGRSLNHNTLWVFYFTNSSTTAHLPPTPHAHAHLHEIE